MAEQQTPPPAAAPFKGKGKQKRFYGKNADDRGTKPTDFEPGAHQVIIKSTTITRPGLYNEFELDISGLNGLAEDLGRFLLPVAERNNAGMIDLNEITDSTKRMCNMAMAKKLAHSADPESIALHARELSLLRKSTIYVAAPVKRIVEGFGWFTYNGAAFRPAHPVLWTFNAFAHATGIPGQDGIPVQFGDGLFVVNRNMVGWKRELVAMCGRTYNSWAEQADNEIPLGDLITRPPYAVRGFNALVALMQGVALPPDVGHAIQVAAAVEQAYADNAFPNQAQTLALFQFNMVVVDWTREVQDRLMERYVRLTQNRMSGLMEHIFEGVVAEKFADNGSPWQLMNHINGYVATHPFTLPVNDIEIGLVIQNHTRYRINTELIETASTESGATARDKYLKSMVRKGGHVV